MGKHLYLHQLHIFSVILLLVTKSSSDYTDLVYKGCADQKFQDPTNTYEENLKTLYENLMSQSAKTNFSKFTAGETGKYAILGLYQCRGDLNAVDCYNCVSKTPKLARKLCGGDALAARVQLLGCYMRYEVVGFKQVSSTELLYKYCKDSVVRDTVGFEDMRDKAFQEVEDGVVNAGGFYAASYEGQLYVMGQCEGDLVASDCGDCVRTALERVKVECGDDVQGQVYLHQCYISYTYYPNGVGANEKASSPGPRRNASKTVAIVLGATAAAGFVVAVLLFTKSVLKKKSSTPKYYYGG